MKIMTFNLKNDMIFTRSHLRWKIRKNIVIQLIKQINPDIIGVQELTPEIKREFKTILSEYEFVGESRNHKDAWMNEHNDIGYLKDKYECLSHHTVWLSHKPSIEGSRLWSSIFPRICTTALIKEKESNQTVAVFNTHLDHLLATNREEEIKIVLDQMKNRKDYPLVLMGDFNTNIQSAALKKLVKSELNLVSVCTNQNTMHHGSGKSKTDKLPIDYIFINNRLEVLEAHVITTSFNGIFPSDHFPIICEVQIK